MSKVDFHDVFAPSKILFFDEDRIIIELQLKTPERAAEIISPFAFQTSSCRSTKPRQENYLHPLLTHVKLKLAF